MSNEQILELAKKHIQYRHLRLGLCFNDEQLQAFAKELMQIQRENDAKICEALVDIRLEHGVESAGVYAAAEAIRKGGSDEW